MILKYARGISYSQLYKNEEDNGVTSKTLCLII